MAGLQHKQMLGLIKKIGNSGNLLGGIVGGLFSAAD